jgi:hypothetical protein
MKCAVQVYPAVMIYIPSFINTSTCVQKLIGGFVQTHKEDGDIINLLLSFTNWGKYAKIEVMQCPK